MVKIDSLLRQVQIQIRTLQGLPQPIEINNLTNHERTGQHNRLAGKMVLMINIEIGIIDALNLVKGQDLIDQEQIDPLTEDSMGHPELKDQDLTVQDRHVELAHPDRDNLMVHPDQMVQDLVVPQDSTAPDGLMVPKDSMVHQGSMVGLDSMVLQDKMVREISIHVIIALPEVEVLAKEVVLLIQCEVVFRQDQCVKTGLVLADHPLVVGLVVDGVVVVVDDFKVLNLLTAL